jgi:nucleoprotein TPR
VLWVRSCAEEKTKVESLYRELELNYQRQVRELADTLSRMEQLRDELQHANNAARESAAKIRALEAELTAQQERAAQQQHHHHSRVEELQQQVIALEKQNELLHAQLEPLLRTAHPLSLSPSEAEVTEVEHLLQKQQQQQQLDSSGISTTFTSSAAVAVDTSSPQQIKRNVTTSDLWGVIRYLRREREIERCKYDVLVSEHERLKQQLTLTERTRDELRLALENLQRQQQQQTPSTPAQLRDSDYEHIKAQLGELNLLRESNQLLRQQSTELKNEIAKLRVRCEELSVSLEPLRLERDQLLRERDLLKQSLDTTEQQLTAWKQRVTTLIVH